MAWPSRTMGQTLSGDGAETIGADLWDRDAIAAETAWTWVAGSTGTTTTLSIQATSFFRLPQWAEATAVISLTFTAKRTSGVSGTANFRLSGRESGGSFVNGSPLATTLTTSFAPYGVTLAVPASPSWTEVIIEFVLEAQRPASGIDSNWQTGLSNLMGNMRVAPI